MRERIFLVLSLALTFFLLGASDVVAQETGTITITKVVDGPTPPSDWEIDINEEGLWALLPAAGGSVTSIDFPVGTYTFSEVEQPNYDVSISCDNGVTSESNSITLDLTTDGFDVTCTFTNNYQGGTLTITKVVEGPDPGTNWEIDLDGGFWDDIDPGGGSTIATDFPVGSYTFSEVEKPNYDVSISCTNGATSDSNSVSLELLTDDFDVTCTFTNDYQGGTLTIIKVVNGPAPLSDWEIDINEEGLWALLPAAGGTVTSADLPVGSYTFSEVEKPSYDVSISCTNGATSDSNSVDLDLLEDDFIVTCTFTNTFIVNVVIDIKPGSDPNSINCKKQNQVIAVAILTTNDFDATTVDPLSVQFGPSGATEVHGRGHLEDVDGDSDLDMVLHFKTSDTGIACGDTSASLSGETTDGTPFVASDTIRTVN